MIRSIFLIFVFLFSVQLEAQEDLFELVVKGKKQGVKSISSQEWLIPLAKQTIIEPHENLFLIIDKKNQLIQGFYQDKYFKKITSQQPQLFFGQTGYVEDVLVFDEGIINITQNTITRPRYKYATEGLKGPGAGFFKGKLIVASAADSLGLYHLEVSDNKNGVIERFNNVDFLMADDYLLVGITRPTEYHPDYLNSYELTQIEVFKINPGNLQKIATYDKSDTSEYEEFLNYLNGYSTGITINDNKVDYGQFLNTDYKTDSAEKYDLIFETGAGILFASRNSTYHLSKKGEWEPIRTKLFFKDNYDFGENGFFSIEEHNEVVIINSYLMQDEMIILEEEVDGGGLTEFYAEVQDVQTSGVWDWSMNKWLVPNEYTEVVLLNDLYLAQKTVYSEHETDEHRFNRSKQIDIYNEQGEKIKSLTEPSEEAVLKVVYEGMNIAKVENTYSIYQIKNNGNTALLDFSEYLLSAFCIASFEEGVVPDSYNPESHAYITRKGKQFFLNQYDVETGVTTREIDNEFGAYMSYAVEGDGSFIRFSDQFTAGENGEQVLSGVYKMNENQAIIYNNTFPETFEKYNDFGEPAVEYDSYGNVVYLLYYDQVGRSRSGIWNNATRQWDINPEYLRILPTEMGYTCLKRFDKVEGEITKEDSYRIIRSAEFSPVTDSFALDLYDKNFKLINENIDPYTFISDYANIKYFINDHEIGECVHYPVCIDETYDVYDTYGGLIFKGDKGYALIRQDVFNYTPTVLVSEMDWLYESDRFVYALKADSLFIYDLDLGAKSKAGLPVTGNFIIKEFENINVIELETGIWEFHNNGQRIKIFSYTDERDWNGNNVSIERSGNVILCNAMQSVQIYPFLNDDYDGFESYLTVSPRNDFLWENNQGKWSIVLTANTIKETPFGYFVDATFINQDFATPEYFTNERFYGNKTLLNKDLQKISELPLSAYYGSSPVEGRDDLFIIQYGSDNRPELMGIISKDGKIAVEACDYDIKGNTLEYSPCSSDGLGGSAFDNFGNQVVKTIELK